MEQKNIQDRNVLSIDYHRPFIQVTTDNNLCLLLADELRIVRSSTLDFITSSDSVAGIVSRCSSPILREFSVSSVDKTGNVEGKILVSKPPEDCARCAKCGHPVNGPYCQRCALLREKLEEDLVTYFQTFQNTFESSDDSTNVINAPREPFVVKKDHGVNPPPTDKCCCECGNALDGIFCQQCICKSYGKGDHIGYNCPPKVPIISNPKPCNQTMNNELPQTLPSFDTTTNVINAPREPFVVKKDHGVNPPPTDKCYGIFCQQCICKSYGKGDHIGYNCPPKVPIISNPKPCNQTMNNELPQTLPSFDTTCYSDKENSVPCISKTNFVDESSNIFNPPPQPPIYSCEFYESNAKYGHYCTPQALFINLEPGYSQDFNFSQNIHDFQQHSRTTLMEQMTKLTSMCEMVCQNFQKKQEEKRIEEEQGAKARYWKIPACCDDDDDYNSAITPVLSTEETDNSLSMGDEHLDTILATESDKVIKSSVEDLVPILTKDHFEIVINSNDDISSSDDDSIYNENIEYVEASPHDSEVVSLEVAKIVILEEEEIEDDNLRKKLLNEKGDCLSWGEMVVVMGSRVVMEIGEKMAEKGVGKMGGKHCAGHNVLNMNVTRVSTFGDFTTLVPVVSKD
uniref:Uncharacterized protein n=1 Tax=Tanacetum cinerariifolium TaxID=118510 RepID=A0A6L2MSE1_TANCI|nr:hypothetical protein [Tanacetum cinerariifolium]